MMRSLILTLCVAVVPVTSVAATPSQIRCGELMQEAAVTGDLCASYVQRFGKQAVKSQSCQDYNQYLIDMKRLPSCGRDDVDYHNVWLPFQYVVNAMRNATVVAEGGE